jgi:glutamate synthase (NADPH/NADH) small chain
MKKNPMPEQPAAARAKNFDEVALGYELETAKLEASRCLKCKTEPCRKGCPVGVDIPKFIECLKNGDIDSAYIVLKTVNSLPAVCGRVCPQEVQCEKHCVLGIKGEPVAIGRLERFAADNSHASAAKNCSSNGKKVAIVGSGPSGLTAAGDLAKLGYDVTIFEALHLPGGVLMYGIPEFRLPKSIVQAEINDLRALGVKIETNCVVGRTVTIDELMNEEKYQAVFIGTGAGLPYFMQIPGEQLNGVYSANEFLTRSNLMKAYSFPENRTPIYVGKKAAIVGGGNVAMDAARTALRLGAEKVYIVYRRSMAEMPARIEEAHHAVEEGVEFLTLCAPLKITGNSSNWVTGMECIRMELGEPDGSGRCRPIVVDGSNFMLDIDVVVMAIGQGPNPLVQQTTPHLDTNKYGYIVASEESGATSRPGVFAGGDIVTGAATVILAMGAGKNAAVAIDEYLKKQ